MKRHKQTIKAKLSLLLLSMMSVSLASAEELSKFEQDRQAILKFAGKFKVNFLFQETVAIQKGYELKAPYHAQAHELVKVVEDTGQSITLQHLLVVNSKKENKQTVIKHWSQTWNYEDQNILKFVDKRHWQNTTITPEQAKGTWSQMVSQIDDSPRYEGYGTWKHEGGKSVWISSETNRPLPRREYTKRKDYNILKAINTKVITENGWVHEQQNAKLVKKADKPEQYLAHEIGVNTYTRDDSYDFSAAEDYWKKYSKQWAVVRKTWEEIYKEHATIKIQCYIDDSDDTLREMTNDLVEESGDKGEQKLPNFKEKVLSYFSK